MQCSKCGSDNPAKAKFCLECGAATGVTAAGTAERRQITVLFADIVDSSKLAEILDPEDLRELYSSYHSVCGEIIRHYEGHLAQYLGDGVLAYFGFPAAHEDDGARAVRSGLEILARAGGITLSGNRPRVRMGVHTGLVVVGDMGSDGH